MTTLKDVARGAEVSVATAARVLRNDPSLTVRPATRERVERVAHDLAYRPNRVASGLRTRRTGTIAVVLPDPQNIVWSDALRGIERAAAEREYVIAVADAHGPTLDPQQLSRFVLEGRMDGFLVAFATIVDALVDQIVGRGLPLLAINSRSDNVDGSVTMDDETGSRLAVDHLVALGHRRIGFMAGRWDTDVGRRREAGFRTAMLRHGLPIDPAWMAAGDYTEQTAYELGANLMRLPDGQRPTALYTVNLASGLGLRAATHRSGRRIPEDLSVITMDDHPVLEHTDPALTSIQMPMAEMGELGVKMLLDLVDGRAMSHVVTSTPPRLVIRRSTAAPPD